MVSTALRRNIGTSRLRRSSWIELDVHTVRPQSPEAVHGERGWIRPCSGMELGDLHAEKGSRKIGDGGSLALPLSRR